MMEIERILDDLELMLKDSKKVPLSNGKVMVDSHRFLEQLDRIKMILPEELETARLIMSEKERIVKDAFAQADEYMEQSRDQVARMVDDNEITRNAMQVGREIIAKAEEQATIIRRDADEYADGVLTHIEIVLRRGLEAINQGKEEIRKSLEDY